MFVICSYFFTFTLYVLFTSRVEWREIRRSFFFILGFVFFFAILTFLTGRGGMEVYPEEHLIHRFEASFSILGWTPIPGHHHRADFLCTSVNLSVLQAWR